MRKKLNLNQDWQFHLGEINKPKLLAKKLYAFGGLTAPLTNEKVIFYQLVQVVNTF